MDERCDDAFADSGPYFPFSVPTGVGLISATKQDSTGHPQLYGGSSGQPDNWSFYQWHTPNDFPPLSYVQSTNEWMAGNGMSAVHWYPPASGQAQSIALAQNGQYLPCANGEFDLGLGPNGWADPTSPSQYPATATKDTPTLNLLSHLYMSGDYTLNGARSGGSSQYKCDVNQANAGLAVVLLNKKTSPYQFFFYQLHLSEICVQSGSPNDQYTGCQQAINKQNPNWFWTGTAGPNAHSDGTYPNWGIDDHLNSYGSTTITDSATHGLALDLLPRIKQLITSNTYNMDPNPADWEVTGTGFGQADWGNVYFATTFKDFIVLYSCYDNQTGCPASD